MSSENSANPIVKQLYRQLPPGMFVDAQPETFASPSLIELNHTLLKNLDLNADWFATEEGLSLLAGSVVDPSNPPIAMAYSGDQFGHWVPLLGDGRAHMLGQTIDTNGSAIDVQLKGSGRTVFSRGGDGRAALGAVLREYMISEAMAGLGIPTTRSLAVIGTGEHVMRERALPGAVLVRTAKSHVRVGTFQFAAANAGENGVRALADFVIEHYFPGLAAVPHKYAELLSVVIERQAVLIAKWMNVGFIHGVMNTDNMSIIGETIDYGPCAFMDEFQSDKVFSSIDRFGRYAWDQQPSIALWNLNRLAQTLAPLLHASRDQAKSFADERLEQFGPAFQSAFHAGFRHKLCLRTDADTTETVMQATFTLMAGNGIDFTEFFDRLTLVAEGQAESALSGLFNNQPNITRWLQQWQALRSVDADDVKLMRQSNPAVIARNHRVEQAIEAAVEHADLEPFRRLCRVVATPYAVDAADHYLQQPPLPEERVTETFCGT